MNPLHLKKIVLHALRSVLREKRYATDQAHSLRFTAVKHWMEALVAEKEGDVVVEKPGTDKQPWNCAEAEVIRSFLRSRGSCSSDSSNGFWAGSAEKEEMKGAIELCKGCSLRIPCLEYATLYREDKGIWGGVSERGRRRIEKKIKATGVTIHDLRRMDPQSTERSHYREDFLPSMIEYEDEVAAGRPPKTKKS